MDFAKYRDKDIVKLIGIKGMVFHKSDIDKLIFCKDAGFLTGRTEFVHAEDFDFCKYVVDTINQLSLELTYAEDISIHDSYLTFWKIENAYGMEDPSGEYYVHYAIAIQLNGRYIEKEDMNYIFPRFN